MPDQPPQISVIVPAFNAERTLRQSLESVRNQTCSDLEIIIIDDGSTDRTASIAREYCAGEPRARLIRQDNQGVAAARNRAISAARGEWIAPLDADDLWHPEKLERQLAGALANPAAGLIYSWSRFIDAAGFVTGSAASGQASGDVLAEHLRWNFIGNGSTPLIRRSALGDLQYDSRVDGCADYLLQLRLALRCSFALAPYFLIGYRVTETNMSADALRMIRDHVRLYHLLLGDLPEAKRALAHQQLARWRTRLGLVLLRRGQVKGGLEILARAVGGDALCAIDEMRARVGHRRRRGDPEAPECEPGRAFLDYDPSS